MNFIIIYNSFFFPFNERTVLLISRGIFNLRYFFFPFNVKHNQFHSIQEVFLTCFYHIIIATNIENQQTKKEIDNSSLSFITSEFFSSQV